MNSIVQRALSQIPPVGKNAGSKVFVAMSGGVDSSVAAFLLQERGYSVLPVVMKSWDLQNEMAGEEADKWSSPECSFERDLDDVRAVTRFLQIETEIRVFDFVKEYWNEVFEPWFLERIEKGYTPTPDLMCNRAIKFGVFLRKLRELAPSSLFATGHYARLRKVHPNGIPELLRAVDRGKDQSYFLAAVPGIHFRNAVFPVGSLLKQEVRDIAEYLNLPVAQKRSSRGICFVGKRNIASFISKYLPFTAPGSFIDIETGVNLGPHSSLPFQYTIGQKARIGGLPMKYYVVDKVQRGLENQDILVAPGWSHPSLFCKKMQCNDPFWIGGTFPSLSAGSPVMLHCVTSNCDELTPCIVSLGTSKNSIVVEFTNGPKRRVGPGQAVVFYSGADKDVCLGGAWIEGSDRWNTNAGPDLIAGAQRKTRKSKPLPVVILVVGEESACTLARDLLRGSEEQWVAGICVDAGSGKWKFVTALATEITDILSNTQCGTKKDVTRSAEIANGEALIKYIRTKYDSDPIKLCIVAADDIRRRSRRPTRSHTNLHSTWGAVAFICSVVNSTLFSEIFVVTPAGIEDDAWKGILQNATFANARTTAPARILKSMVSELPCKEIVKRTKLPSDSVTCSASKIPEGKTADGIGSRLRSRRLYVSPSNCFSDSAVKTERTTVRARKNVRKAGNSFRLERTNKDVSYSKQLLKKAPSEIFSTEREDLPRALASEQLRHPTEPRRTNALSDLPSWGVPELSNANSSGKPSLEKVGNAENGTNKYSEEVSFRAKKEDLCCRLTETLTKSSPALSQRPEPASSTATAEQPALPAKKDLQTLDSGRYLDQEIKTGSTDEALGHRSPKDGKNYKDEMQAICSDENDGALCNGVSGAASRIKIDVMEENGIHMGHNKLKRGTGENALSCIPLQKEDEVAPVYSGLTRAEVGGKMVTEAVATTSKGEIRDSIVEDCQTDSQVKAQKKKRCTIWRGSVKIVSSVSTECKEEVFAGFQIQCDNLEGEVCFKKQVYNSKNNDADPQLAVLIRVEAPFSPFLAMSGGHERLEMTISDCADFRSVALMNAWRASRICPVFTIGEVTVSCHWSSKNARDSLICLFPRQTLGPKELDFGLYRQDLMGADRQVFVRDLPSQISSLPFLSTVQRDDHTTNITWKQWMTESTLEETVSVLQKHHEQLKERPSCERSYFEVRSREEKLSRRRRHKAIGGVSGQRHLTLRGKVSDKTTVTSIGNGTPSEYASSRRNLLSLKRNSFRVRASKKALLQNSMAKRQLGSSVLKPNNRSLHRRPVGGKGKANSKLIKTGIREQLRVLSKSSLVKSLRLFYNYGEKARRDENDCKVPKKWRKLGEFLASEAVHVGAKGFSRGDEMTRVGYRKFRRGIHGISWCEDGSPGDQYIKWAEKLIFRGRAEFKSFMQEISSSSQAFGKLTASISNLKRRRGAQSTQQSFTNFFKTLAGSETKLSGDHEVGRKRKLSERRTPQVHKRRLLQGPKLNPLTRTETPSGRPLADISRRDRSREGAGSNLESESVFVEAVSTPTGNSTGAKFGSVSDYCGELDEVRYVLSNGFSVTIPLRAAAPLYAALQLENVKLNAESSMLDSIKAHFTKKCSDQTLDSFRRIAPWAMHQRKARLLDLSVEKGVICYEVCGMKINIDMHILAPLYAELKLAGIELEIDSPPLSPIISYFERQGILCH